MHIEENEARTKVIVAPAIGKRTGSLFNQESCSPERRSNGRQMHLLAKSDPHNAEGGPKISSGSELHAIAKIFLSFR